MPRTGILLAIVLLVLPACGTTARPKPVFESWQAAYLQGVKIGHAHTVVVEEKRGDEKVYRTTRTMELTVKRYGAVQQMKIEQGCEEDAAGNVVSLSLVQSVGDSKPMTMSATVKGDRLLLKTDGAERKAKWDGTAAGLYAQERAFAERKPKAGDKFSLKTFELAAQVTLSLNVEVKAEEATDRLVLKKDAGGKALVGREPAKLLRAEVATEKIRIGTTDVQLPPKTVWLDAEWQTAREQFEFPGLGVVTQYTTTKELALMEKVSPALLPDLGLNVMIPLKQTLSRPQDTRSVTYRVKVKDGLEPPFVEDARQAIANRKGDTFELRVTSVREPGSDAAAPSPGKEFTQSSAFIDSDDDAVKEIARKAVGEEKSAHAKALKLEKWVHDNMKFSASAGFPAASKVARDLEGDCRQHSLLLAALLRAAGVPSRTALGLVYYREEGRSPFLAFHMWTEAYVGGKWLALDAVSGRGGVAATHLAMAHHSWAGTETLAPLLPIAQSLGKLQVEIVSER